MTEPTAREREMERVLLDLMIFAAPFGSGRGMSEARKNLVAAIQNARAVLNAKPCEKEPSYSLVEWANAGDEERQKSPNYRKDLDG